MFATSLSVSIGGCLQDTGSTQYAFDTEKMPQRTKSNKLLKDVMTVGEKNDPRTTGEREVVMRRAAGELSRC